MGLFDLIGSMFKLLFKILKFILVSIYRGLYWYFHNVILHVKDSKNAAETRKILKYTYGRKRDVL